MVILEVYCINRSQNSIIRVLAILEILTNIKIEGDYYFFFF